MKDNDGKLHTESNENEPKRQMRKSPGADCSSAKLHKTLGEEVMQMLVCSCVRSWVGACVHVCVCVSCTCMPACGCVSSYAHVRRTRVCVSACRFACVRVLMQCLQRDNL